VRRLPIIVIAVLTFGALSGVAAYERAQLQAETESKLRWQEISWPFPRDGWPAGRAFRCAACGDVEVYVRPKIGFCNCGAGVADDDEVDRVADLDLISERFVPVRSGDAVRVAELSGRMRAYDLAMRDGARHSAVGVALAHRCDLLVAVAQGRARPSELQQMVLQLLDSSEINRWMAAALGMR
jgi:hypothetical protein